MEGWVTTAIDFVNAFCQTHYPDLMDPVWIHPQRSFYRDLRGTHVLKLKNSMYGLRDAPRLWFENLFTYLLSSELGFIQSNIDPCLLIRADMIIIVYVDDMGVAAEREELIDELISFLQSKGLELQREGKFQDYLGIIFSHSSDGSTHMIQSGLIKKIIQATGMEQCNPNKTPALKTCLGKDEDGEPMDATFNYRSIVGMLLYLSGNTRPDIAYAVSQVARFTHNPKKTHATAIKMLVRYLAGTINKGIIIPKPKGDLVLKCYVDSDFAGLYKVDPDHEPSSAKSRTGYIIFLGPWPLIWKSFLQSEVSLSTMEAEYSALSSATRMMLPIITLVKTLVSTTNCSDNFKAIILNPSLVYEDNNGAYTVAKNCRVTSRTKYFNVKLHHFWQYVHDGTFDVQRIDTKDQLADFLTKGLTRDLHENNRKSVQGW